MKQLLLLLSMFIGSIAFAQKGLSFDVRVGTPYSRTVKQINYGFNKSNESNAKAHHFLGVYLGIRSSYNFSERFSVFFEGALERRRYAYRNRFSVGSDLINSKVDRLLLHAGVGYKLLPWLEFNVAPFFSNTFSVAIRESKKEDWSVSFFSGRLINLNSAFTMQFLIKRWKPYIRYDYYITDFQDFQWTTDRTGTFQLGVAYTILSKEDLK